MNFSIVFQIALITACLAVALYCHVLSRRLRKLNDLETGLGGAIAIMTSEIARLEAAIGEVSAEARSAGEALGKEIQRARDERIRLRMGQEIEGARGTSRRVRRRANAAMDTTKRSVDAET